MNKWEDVLESWIHNACLPGPNQPCFNKLSQVRSMFLSSNHKNILSFSGPWSFHIFSLNHGDWSETPNSICFLYSNFAVKSPEWEFIDHAKEFGFSSWILTLLEKIFPKKHHYSRTWEPVNPRLISIFHLFLLGWTRSSPLASHEEKFSWLDRIILTSFERLYSSCAPTHVYSPIYIFLPLSILQIVHFPTRGK